MHGPSLPAAPESSSVMPRRSLYIWGIALVAALGGLLFGYDWVVIGGARQFYEVYFHLTSAALVGWANSCALVGCLLGSLAAGALADRYGRLPTIRIGYLLALPGLLGLVVAPTLATAFVAAVVCGIGIYIPFSVHTTLGQEYLPNRLGTASGVTLGLAVSAGGIVAPALGALADAHGLGTALAALCAFPVVALLATTHLRETHRTRARAAAVLQ